MNNPSPTKTTQIDLGDKEEDLVLAAKLGQTLLEQNEDLTNENSRLVKQLEVRHHIYTIWMY